MSRRVKIVLLDGASACANGYLVRYKPSASLNYITLDGLQQPIIETLSLSPLSQVYSLQIANLSDGTPYDFEITRQCCDGTNANPVTVSYTTGS